jgi:hypothetical protein
MVGVEDQIDPVARGVECGLAAARMGNRLLAQAVGLANHDLGFVMGESGDEFTVLAALNAVERDLDAVDPVLDLAADLLDCFGACRDELADRCLGRADPSRVPVGQTLMRRHIASGRHDPRTVEQTGADRIADRQADLACVARRADRRKAGGGNLLSEEHPAQGPEL